MHLDGLGRSRGATLGGSDTCRAVHPREEQSGWTRVIEAPRADPGALQFLKIVKDYTVSPSPPTQATKSDLVFDLDRARPDRDAEGGLFRRFATTRRTAAGRSQRQRSNLWPRRPSVSTRNSGCWEQWLAPCTSSASSAIVVTYSSTQPASPAPRWNGTRSSSYSLRSGGFHRSSRSISTIPSLVGCWHLSSRNRPRASSSCAPGPLRQLGGTEV